MKFEGKGYEYKGFYLGQKVMVKGNESIIIGFCESDITKKPFAVYKQSGYISPKIKFSNYITTGLYGYEDCVNWEWAGIDEIEVQDIENVLEIKVIELNNQYSSIEVTYQNTDVLERGNFSDNKIKVSSSISPTYSTSSDTFYIRGNDEKKDNKPFMVENKYVETFKERVRLINEKYGIPKRWRAEYDKKYYYIDDLMRACTSTEINDYVDNRRYEFANYFKTKEECEQKIEKIKKILGDK